MKAATQLNKTSNSVKRGAYYKPEKAKVIKPLSIDDLVKRSKTLLGSKFKLTEHTQKLFYLIVEYINKSPDFEKRGFTEPTKKNNIKFSLDKGLFFISAPGTGKSFIFENLLPGFNFYFPNFKYRQLTAYSIEDIFVKNKSARSILLTAPYNSNLYVDDIGRETTKLMDYGTIIPLIDIFTDTRARLKRQYGVVTHGTSNLSLTELSYRYTKPTYSRFIELFNFITFDANIDFRMI